MALDLAFAVPGFLDNTNLHLLYREMWPNQQSGQSDFGLIKLYLSSVIDGRSQLYGVLWKS